MPRVCHFTGKRTTVGNTYVRRGKAKYLGGVGLKIRGKNKRKFKPNLQTVKIVDENGATQRVKASTRALRDGLVVKPAKRKYVYKHDPEAAKAK